MSGALPVIQAEQPTSFPLRIFYGAVKSGKRLYPFIHFGRAIDRPASIFDRFNVEGDLRLWGPVPMLIETEQTIGPADDCYPAIPIR